MKRSTTTQADVLAELYPEIGAGGFSRDDGTIQFYTRVNALLESTMTILDYGAGRGEWVRDPLEFRRQLRTLRGKVAEVIGADVDDVVRTNPTIDRYVICPDLVSIPLPDESVDMIVADHVFEHIDRPNEIAREMTRILRPRGWVCARTPNRWGYVAAAASLVPNARHVAVLRTVQPERDAEDVFPTRYRLNTMAALREYFPPDIFENFSYFWVGDPAYFGSSAGLAKLTRLVAKIAPPHNKPRLFVFLQKRR